VTQTYTPPTETTTTPMVETPSSDPSSTDSTVPTEPPETDDSASPAVLPLDIAGRPLTLSNIFKYPDGWRDGRYDVADRKQATGIGGIVRLCGDSSAQVLELRLANNFNRFRLEFGQSNSSDDSDQVMVVRVDLNGQYRDQKTSKLNQITSFDLSVPKVNALKISISLKEGRNCGSGTIEAVLMNLILS
jgi:hypothetical protein